jgi:hypothetical protein
VSLLWQTWRVLLSVTDPVRVMTRSFFFPFGPLALWEGGEGRDREREREGLSQSVSQLLLLLLRLQKCFFSFSWSEDFLHQWQYAPPCASHPAPRTLLVPPLAWDGEQCCAIIEPPRSIGRRSRGTKLVLVGASQGAYLGASQLRGADQRRSTGLGRIDEDGGVKLWPGSLSL